MALENLLWGDSRVHGERLKLGYDIGETTVAKYMVRQSGSPCLQIIPSELGKQ